MSVGIIDAKEFTIFLGETSTDNSYIEFGANQDDQRNVTFIDLVPLTPTSSQQYWSININEFKYGNETFDLTTSNTVWDTGSSLIGFTNANLQKLSIKIANGRNIFMVNSYFSMHWDGVEDISDLEFTFSDKTIIVPNHAFVHYTDGICSLMIENLGEPEPEQQFTVLGSTFMRGIKTIFDMENQRIGIFPQQVYTYKEEGKKSMTWLWILLGALGGAVLLAAAAYGIYKWSRKNDTGRYQKVTDKN